MGAIAVLAHVGTSVWPVLLAATVLTLALCGRGHLVRRGRTGSRVAQDMRLVALVAGGTAFVIALSPPLERASSDRFSLHMVQHLLLISVAAPLLVVGRPSVLVAAVLPPGTMGRATPSSITRVRWWMIGPAALGVTTLASIGVLWLWHAPRMYDAALESEFVHVIEHVTLFATAYGFWLLVLHRRTEAHLALAVLLAAAIAHALLGGLITFTDRALYRSYDATDLGDQMLAGLLMWVPGGVVHLAAAVVVVLAWVDRSDRRARWRELASTGRGSIDESEPADRQQPAQSIGG